MNSATGKPFQDEQQEVGTIVLPDGTESPITEEMIQNSLNALVEDNFFPDLKDNWLGTYYSRVGASGC